MCGNGVTTYAQYLGILLLEPAVKLPEEGGLCSSTRCKVEHVEGQHHVFLALVLAHGDVPLADRGQLEIRRLVANFCRHIPTFPHIAFRFASSTRDTERLYPTAALLTTGAAHSRRIGMVYWPDPISGPSRLHRKNPWTVLHLGSAPMIVAISSTLCDRVCGCCR